MYKVVLDEKVFKHLSKISKPDRVEIVEKIKELSDFDNLYLDVKMLKGKAFESGFRLRVGDYRVIFTKDTLGKIIRVCIIGHRKDIYKYQ